MMEKNRRRLILRTLAVMFVLCAAFIAGCKSSLSKDAAQTSLKALDPDVVVTAVNQTAIKGVVEVIVEGKGKKGLVYMDTTGKYLFSGNLIEIATKTNVTQKRFAELDLASAPKVDFGAIPLEDSVIMGDAGAKYKVVVFDDPD